ncbi:amino acid ABC transporter permease [Nonomuraea sp. NPDC002799]
MSDGPLDGPLDGALDGAVPIRAVPVRHPGRWTAAAVLLVLLAAMLASLAGNPRVEWGTVGDYLFRGLTLRGVLVTLELTALAMVVGIVGGVLLAVMRLSGNPVLKAVSWVYVWFFRGTPQLVQIIFWGFLGALYPRLSLGIPFTDVVFWSAETSSVVGAFTAALLGLSLNEAAYAAEIVRGGIVSVDHGQREAAQSLGLGSIQTMRVIILPQAMRVIIPPMGNEVITMLKTTALVSVIAGQDLLTNLQNVYAQNFKVIPLLIVASIWYLALTTVLSLGQTLLERRFGRGVAVR